MSTFVQQQWNEYCENLNRTAIYVAAGRSGMESEFASNAKAFQASNSPDSYVELLNAIAAGAAMVEDWKHRTGFESSSGNQETKYAYTDCSNHAPMPIPTETMAEQAEQAKSSEG